MLLGNAGERRADAGIAKHPDHWMKPLKGGELTGLCEIPASWYLDDLPPMMFIKKAANSHGWVNPKDVEELWLDQFNYHYREEDEFVFPVTVHPDVCGHPHGEFVPSILMRTCLLIPVPIGLLMLERYASFNRPLSPQSMLILAGSSNTSTPRRASSGLRWKTSVIPSRRRTSHQKVLCSRPSTERS